MPPPDPHRHRSPFLTPAGRPRRRRRRRRRPAFALGVVLVPILLALALLALFGPLRSGSSAGHPPVLTLTGPGVRRAGAASGGARSATGGGQATVGDAALLSFHHPPHAGMLFDLDTGRVLWSIDPMAVVPVASLTKMMTALLVVRALAPEAWVRVSHAAVNAAGSKVGVLPAGRRVRMLTLLYGLLLPSGNDAAIALAEAVAGSVPAFVARMNDEARRLHLGCTRFVSPDGLEDGNRSCAADLARLAALDLAQPLLAHVAGTAATVQPLPIKGGRVWLYNNNPLLVYGYPGAIGLKTGETEAAGRCLVGAARRGGVRLGVVLLDSPELGRQAAALLDRGFAGVYHLPVLPTPPIPAGR
jgi:serine-type D-Ala-D-Ala carboxypeptidase (penicillin-binding protein 5/6)